MKVRAKNLKPGDVILMNDGPATVNDVTLQVEVSWKEGAYSAMPANEQVEILRPKAAE